MQAQRLPGPSTTGGCRSRLITAIVVSRPAPLIGQLALPIVE
jgi:hypothetical protein